MGNSLYERLGESEGIRAIANDIVDLHFDNPTIAPRFKDTDKAKLKEGAATFFIAGTGGPADAYKGQDMLATHRGMNISASEFMAVLDDALGALEKNHIPLETQQEVLFVLYSMRKDVMQV